VREPRFRSSLKAAPISTAVSDLLGLPVSRSSVEGCLAAKARGKNALFERIAPGCYQLKPSTVFSPEPNDLETVRKLFRWVVVGIGVGTR